MTTPAQVVPPAESAILQRQNNTFLMRAGATGAALSMPLMVAYWFLGSRPDAMAAMPGLDGFETTPRLRGAGFGAPIVAFTASAQRDLLGECERAGMNGCLLKPMRLEHVVPLLRGLLRVDGTVR